MAPGEAAADTEHGACSRSPRRRRPADPPGSRCRRNGRAGPALGLETANDLAEIGGGVAHGRGRDGQRRRTSRLRRAERHRLGATADLVHGPHARGTAARTRAGLERLEAFGEQLRQHLEDALGEADAARLVVVEVDGRGELVALHELGPHDLARDDLSLRRRRAVAQPGADIADVAEEKDGGQASGGGG